MRRPTGRWCWREVGRSSVLCLPSGRGRPPTAMGKPGSTSCCQGRREVGPPRLLMFSGGLHLCRGTGINAMTGRATMPRRVMTPATRGSRGLWVWVGLGRLRASAQHQPMACWLAAVAGQVRAHDPSCGDRMGLRTPGHGPGRLSVWGAGDSGGEGRQAPHSQRTPMRPQPCRALDGQELCRCIRMHRLEERRRHPGAGFRSRRRPEACLASRRGFHAGGPGMRLHRGWGLIRVEGRFLEMSVDRRWARPQFAFRRGPYPQSIQVACCLR